MIHLQSKFKPILFFLLLVAACTYIAFSLLLLGAIPESVYNWMPQDGVWYCEELQIQIPFDDLGECYAVIDGQPVKCVFENDRGSSWFSVSIWNEKNGGFIGENILVAEVVSISDDSFLVREWRTDEEYVFILVTSSR